MTLVTDHQARIFQPRIPTLSIFNKALEPGRLMPCTTVTLGAIRPTPPAAVSKSPHTYKFMKPCFVLLRNYQSLPFQESGIPHPSTLVMRYKRFVSY